MSYCIFTLCKYCFLIVKETQVVARLVPINDWTWFSLLNLYSSSVVKMFHFGACKVVLHENWLSSSPEPKVSWRLTRWAYSIPMVRCLSVVVVHTFELEYLSLDQILCVASLGWGKDCIRFLCRLDQNYGFHGNRKCPLAYNGENVVSTLTHSVLIQSSSNLQVMRTSIKSRTSMNLGQISLRS